MPKWITVAIVVGSLYLLTVIGSVVYTQRWSAAQRQASPAASAANPFPWRHHAPWDGPPGPSGFPQVDYTVLARYMGFALYPGATGGGGGWGGSWGGADANVEGHINFGVRAPAADVVRFYQEKYRGFSPLVRTATGLSGAETLLLWQDDRAGYGVLVTARRGLSPMTFFQLARTSFGARTIPQTSASPYIPPGTLGLTLCPKATVDYSGWAQGQNGRIAMARLQVAGSPKQVAEFYDALAKQHGSRGSGRSEANFLTVQADSSWEIGDDRYTATLLCLSSRFPAVVWLQRAEGESWDVTSRRQIESFRRSHPRPFKPGIQPPQKRQ